MTIPGYFGTFDRLGILDYDVIKKNNLSRLERKPTSRISNLVLPMLDVKKMKNEEKEEGWVTEEEEEEEGKRRVKLPEISTKKVRLELWDFNVWSYHLQHHPTAYYAKLMDTISEVLILNDVQHQHE